MLKPFRFAGCYLCFILKISFAWINISEIQIWKMYLFFSRFISRLITSSSRMSEITGYIEVALELHASTHSWFQTLKYVWKCACPPFFPYDLDN